MLGTTVDKLYSLSNLGGVCVRNHVTGIFNDVDVSLTRESTLQIS
jgi:hypothetical protein